MASPLAEGDRPAHAESSGASAVAAGALLLVIEQNAELGVEEVDRLLIETTIPIDPAQRCKDPDLGDPSDLLPDGRDPDGHNAKHGYGRLCVAAACLSARDPITATLVGIGEMHAAEKYAAERSCAVPPAYSDRLARWSARVLLADPIVKQAFRVIARAMRLSARRDAPEGPAHLGQLTRQLGLAVRLLLRARPPREIEEELICLEARIRDALAHEGSSAAADEALVALAKRVFATEESSVLDHAAPQYTARSLEHVPINVGSFSKRESASH